jgi:predicted DNA-binding transcriptional regulator AlpA
MSVIRKTESAPGKISKLDGLPQLLTRHDLAALLDVHFETVKRLEREGRLPAPIRISSKVIRYDKAEVQKFLQDATSRRSTT